MWLPSFVGRVALTFAAAWTISACTARLPPPGKVDVPAKSYELREMKYPSGLRVLVERDPGSQHVAVAMVVGTGGTGDPEGREGLAHLLEHLVFRARYGGEESVRQRLEAAGASYNASTGLDVTTYWAVAQPDQLDELLLLSAARVADPLAGVDDAGLAIEREVVRNEVRQRNDAHGVGTARAALQASLFPHDHAYARPIGGTMDSLDAITLDDLHAFAKAHYQPANVTLVISGDLDLARAHEWVAQTFLERQLAAEGKTEHLRPEHAPFDPSEGPSDSPIANITANTPTREMWVGWTLPASKGEDHYVIEIAARQLEWQLAFAAIRRPQIGAVNCGLQQAQAASILVCRAWLRGDTSPDWAASNLLDELFKLWSTQRADDIDAWNRRNRVISAVQLALETEDPLQRSLDRAMGAHRFGDPGMFNQRISAIANLDQKAVSAVARQYLTRERARFVYVEPDAGMLRGDAQLVDAAAIDGTESLPATTEPITGDPVRILSKLDRVALSNGATAYIVERSGPPLAAVATLLRGGRSVGPSPEAALFGQTLSYRNARQQGFVFQDYGGNFYIQRDVDHYATLATGAVGSIGNLVAISVENASSQTMTNYKRELAEYAPILREIEKHELTVATRSFEAALYGNHAYGAHPPIDAWSDTAMKDAREWQRRLFRPSNAVMVAVVPEGGNAARPYIERFLGRWSEGSTPTTIDAPEPAPMPEPTQLRQDAPGASQAFVQIGCRLPTASEASEASYDVLAAAIEMAIHHVLRESMGATYGFHGRAQILRGGTASLRYSTLVGNANLSLALQRLRATWSAFGNELPDELVARAQRAIRANHDTAYRTNAAVAHELIRRLNLDWDPTSLDAYPERVAGVSATDLRELFETCSATTVLSVAGDPDVVDGALAGTTGEG